jgi:uncharacterized protein
MPELVLQVTDIDERGKDYDFELGASWLDAALSDTPLRRDPQGRNGHVHVHAQRNGMEILVNGAVDAELLVECGRCLQASKLAVHTSLTALLEPGRDGAPATEVELEAEDLDRVTFNGHELVLDELVREHLLLECPMQPLCAPDCPGIQIPAGVKPPSDVFGDGSTDPRLLPLRELRAKLSEKKE